LATVCAWHAVFAAAFVVWVLTWPDEVSAGGHLNFTTSRPALAVLLAVLVVIPGLGISFAIACGLLALLRKSRRPGVLTGTFATLIGLASVATALAIYAATRR
jgi:hypothetical protein